MKNTQKNDAGTKTFYHVWMQSGRITIEAQSAKSEHNHSTLGAAKKEALAYVDAYGQGGQLGDTRYRIRTTTKDEVIEGLTSFDAC